MTGDLISGKELTLGLPSRTFGFRKIEWPDESVFVFAKLQDFPKDILSAFELNSQRANPKAKKELMLSLAGKYLAVHSLCSYLGRSPEQLHFSVSGTGKPYLVSGDAFFNISHSGDIAVCAVGKTEVGADVELIRRPFPQNVARRVFSDSELRDAASAEDGDAYLTYLWTLHEAYVKMTGVGVAGLSELDLAGTALLTPDVGEEYRATVIFKNNIQFTG